MHVSTLPRRRPLGESVLAGTIFVVATIAIAAVGNVATSRGQAWYDGLERPGYTPPDATFAVVWTVLYAMIALAGWLAWRASPDPRPTVWWAIQMTLNLAWTVVFFGFRSPLGGVVVIALLLVAVARHITVTARVSAPAAALLFPYFAWCAFAGALVVGVAVLN